MKFKICGCDSLYLTVPGIFNSFLPTFVSVSPESQAIIFLIEPGQGKGRRRCQTSPMDECRIQLPPLPGVKLG